MSRSKKRNQWRARIKYKGRSIHLGRFETEEEAARAYYAKAKEFFGEFAWLNFPARSGVRKRKKVRNYLKILLINRFQLSDKIEWLAK